MSALGVPHRTAFATLLYFALSETIAGDVSFDYSNHNGIYQIGYESYIFDTVWSRASDSGLNFYVELA
jgi:hypothetical protein